MQIQITRAGGCGHEYLDAALSCGGVLGKDTAVAQCDRKSRHTPHRADTGGKHCRLAPRRRGACRLVMADITKARRGATASLSPPPRHYLSHRAAACSRCPAGGNTGRLCAVRLKHRTHDVWPARRTGCTIPSPQTPGLRRRGRSRLLIVRVRTDARGTSMHVAREACPCW